MLKIEKLTKRYKNTLAVDEVSFMVDTGRVGILLGPNGAGKSTIIKSIASLLRFSGSICIHNYPSRNIEAKKVFAYVPEIPALYGNLTVKEHFQFILKAYNKEDDGYMNVLINRFDLDDKQDTLGNELSKGMMQKVSICCALLIRPKVILFDEPMIGLDPKAIKELKDLIIELKEQGTTILISTHMLDMVESVWDDMFIINKGKLVASYKKEDVKGEELSDLFFSNTDGQLIEEVNHA